MTEPDITSNDHATNGSSTAASGTALGSAAGQTSLVGRKMSFADAALAEYGKQLILNSAETALDFHKTMLGVSATYGTLVAALIPILMWGDKDAKIPVLGGLILIAPLLLMLASSLIFAWGYFPRHSSISINLIDDIREARESVITSRRVLGAVGLGLFSASLILALGLAIHFRVSV